MTAMFFEMLIKRLDKDIVRKMFQIRTKNMKVWGIWEEIGDMQKICPKGLTHLTSCVCLKFQLIKTKLKIQFLGGTGLISVAQWPYVYTSYWAVQTYRKLPSSQHVLLRQPWRPIRETREKGVREGRDFPDKSHMST